jgi:hypothetical protein
MPTCNQYTDPQAKRKPRKPRTPDVVSLKSRPCALRFGIRHGRLQSRAQALM